MRADIKESANFIVRTAADDYRLARDRGGAKIVGTRKFRFMADGDPSFLEDLRLLLFEDLRIGVDAAVDPFRRLEIWLRQPLAMILSCHDLCSCIELRRNELVRSKL